jgi:hypothetical protein
MLLSLRTLQSATSANDFSYADEAEWTAGDTFNWYFQLVDLSRDRAIDGFKPEGRRYMPAAGATLTVLFGNIDDAKKVTRAATQPYPLDPSIWRVSVLAADPIQGTIDATLTLSEGGVVTTGYAQAAACVRNLTGLAY